MDRKIHVLTVVDRQEVVIRNSNLTNASNKIHVWDDFSSYIGMDKSVKFARRPFAGSRRLHFKEVHSNELYVGTFVADVSPDTFVTDLRLDTKVHMCATKARKILGVGQRTNKFSIWFKRF